MSPEKMNVLLFAALAALPPGVVWAPTTVEGGSPPSEETAP